MFFYYQYIKKLELDNYIIVVMKPGIGVLEITFQKKQGEAGTPISIE
jgi:hypothetical protein